MLKTRVNALKIRNKYFRDSESTNPKNFDTKKWDYKLVKRGSKICLCSMLIQFNVRSTPFYDGKNSM